jgi:tRNA pseudouridine32 synthase/23S rRNA pseudouridine746 synthase
VRVAVITLQHVVVDQDPRQAPALLAGLCRLSKTRIKDAMTKGAVWLTRPGDRRASRRLRRASTELRVGDRLSLYFDPDILALSPPRARVVRDLDHYSVWLKPAGLLAQGTRFADHCALTRQAELALGRPVFPVHRLDREASGLMLLAHNRDAAARLSRLFREGAVDKGYRVQVLGRPAERGLIDLPLDGKPARTHYQVSSYDELSDRAVLEVRLDTGRLHQIRRHLDALGHPVIGDPRYGKGNKDPNGLRLVAHVLQLRCPYSGRPLAFQLAEADIGL